MTQTESNLNRPNLPVRDLYRILRSGFATNTFYPPAEEDSIKQAEDTLNQELPSSYKEFLSCSDGARLNQNDNLLGILTDELADRAGILETQQTLKSEEGLPENLIPFFNTGLVYCFDSTRKLPNGELKIVRWNGLKKEREDTDYQSFAEWLQKSVVEVYHKKP